MHLRTLPKLESNSRPLNFSLFRLEEGMYVQWAWLFGSNLKKNVNIGWSFRRSIPFPLLWTLPSSSYRIKPSIYSAILPINLKSRQRDRSNHNFILRHLFVSISVIFCKYRHALLVSWSLSRENKIVAEAEFRKEMNRHKASLRAKLNENAH